MKYKLKRNESSMEIWNTECFENLCRRYQKAIKSNHNCCGREQFLGFVNCVFGIEIVVVVVV